MNPVRHKDRKRAAGGSDAGHSLWWPIARSESAKTPDARFGGRLREANRQGRPTLAVVADCAKRIGAEARHSTLNARETAVAKPVDVSRSPHPHTPTLPYSPAATTEEQGNKTFTPHRPGIPPPRPEPAAAPRTAMTLIEMVAVMALMSLLITMGVLAFHSWTRGTGLHNARTQVLAGLASARQLALTHRTASEFRAYNDKDRGAFALYVGTNAQERLMGAATHLPRGVTFVVDPDDPPLPPSVRFSRAHPLVIPFRPDGAGARDGWPTGPNQPLRLVLAGPEGERQQTLAVIIHPLTGYVHPEPLD